MKHSLIIVLALAGAVIAAADDEREVLGVRTSPEKAQECRQSGCGLYTGADLAAIRQQARAEALMDIVRSLDRKGCVRDDRS